MTGEPASPAPNGDVENNDSISDSAENSNSSDEKTSRYEKLKKLFKQYKKLFDEFSERNQGGNAYGDALSDVSGERFVLAYDDAIDKLENGTLDTLRNTHLRVLEHTPQIYIDKAGASDREILMAWDIAYLAMNKNGSIPGNYHGLGADIMKALPTALENPLYIVKQKSGRIAAVTEIVVKGKRAVFASIELETYKTTIQDGETEADKYNLVVTVTDAKPNYLQNNIFGGEIVHNKKSEDPAHFILRLKSLEKAVPTYDLAESSDNSILQKSENSNTFEEKSFALPDDADGVANFDITEYNEIKLNGVEQERIQSEALTWDAKHRNMLRSRTLSNGITYRYVIDDDGIVHVYDRERSKNIHNWRKIYGNTSSTRPDKFTKILRDRQGNNSGNSSTLQDGREQGENDTSHNSHIRSEGRSDRAGDTENRANADGRSQGRIQSPFLPIVHTFTDITGKKRNVVKVGNEYMIEGDSRSKYQPTKEAAVEAENERIIARYARRHKSTNGLVKKELDANPEYLKGFRYALPDDSDADSIDWLYEDEGGDDAEGKFDIESILARGVPGKTGRANLTVGELRKVIANNTKQKVYSKKETLELVKKFSGVNELSAKARSEIVEAVWQILNECPDVQYRRAVKGYVSINLPYFADNFKKAKGGFSAFWRRACHE